MWPDYEFWKSVHVFKMVVDSRFKNVNASSKGRFLTVTSFMNEMDGEILTGESLRKK